MDVAKFMMRVDQFVRLAQAIVEQSYGVPSPTLVIGGGRRYLQIWIDKMGGSFDRPEVRRSIFCFIDMTNGDLLKPATLKAPAKHARGNIFDDDYAIRNIGPYGVAYMDNVRNLIKPLGKP